MSSNSDGVRLTPGQGVYDEDGNRIGQIRRFTERGFEVNVGEDAAESSLEHEPAQGFGEGYLMWRCAECGEMGSLHDGIPSLCPSCGASKESLFAWTED